MAKFKPASNFRKPAGTSAKRPAAGKASSGKRAGKSGKGNAWTAYMGGGKSGGRTYDAIPD